ncbi:hypothetical protein [Pseudobdellovibrio exovorus]|uniref:Uncharacterized protein n=1 Tax=Pseudobdellovibrio exovorus JSS TaxID=1184267 RepID=M4V537_9BACT|nr:hypothetical protein [Pseudobdellovibrio exovorus]AGH94298.1 hypothetical protein A11Q_78 [Pseudobdellovibrio exovorus JSS]
MSTNEQNPQQPEQKQNKKRQYLIAVIATLAVSAVAAGSYYALSFAKELEEKANESQEQFVGDPEVSSQLLTECQKSAERIADSQSLDQIITEYKRYADNCRSVYVVVEKESFVRNEGMYPDLVVDIAFLAAKTDKSKAMDVLNFAKGLEPWEYYMGPVICESRGVVEAYIEAFQSTTERRCLKKTEDSAQLIAALKSKNFSLLPQTLKEGEVVWVGLPDSEVGCPEKMSDIMNLVTRLTSGSDVEFEENQSENAESSGLTFIYKTKSDDKMILEFSESDSCLQLGAVLVPDLQP